MWVWVYELCFNINVTDILFTIVCKFMLSMSEFIQQHSSYTHVIKATNKYYTLTAIMIYLLLSETCRNVTYQYSKLV